MREYIKLLRVKHYIKNLIVFLPIFFGGKVFYWQSFAKAFVGFVCFCFASSAIYIFNDYRDIQKDRLHHAKKNRPLASGKISLKNAMILMVICILAMCVLSLVSKSIKGFLLLLLYIVLNIAYSIDLKNKPIIDIIILASGFVIRVIYGGVITNTEISKWLYLVITTGSLYMGLGKRRNELRLKTDTREVLRYYNENFLDKNMYICAALTDVFYALWTLDLGNKYITWTVPCFIVILMCYSLYTEGDLDGDPVEVLIGDKRLMLLISGYAICIFIMLYLAT